MSKVVNSAFFDADWDDGSDENLTLLREAFRTLAGGQFPILHISEEYWFNRAGHDPDADSIHLDSYEGKIDTSKLLVGNIDTYSLRYVQHILKTIFFQAKRMLQEEKALYLEYSTSRKYSFGDTPEWWAKLAPETTENRVVWEVSGEVDS